MSTKVVYEGGKSELASFWMKGTNKISSATHETTASNPTLFPIFRFFATYYNPFLRPRSACSVLEEIGAYVWVFTNLSLLKESPNLSNPRHRVTLLQDLQVFYDELQRGTPL